MLPWVAASAMTGITNIDIILSSLEELADPCYTVHLHFAELEGKGVGERVFDIIVQDQQTLQDFDIVKEAKGINRSVVKSFYGIGIKDTLNIRFIPSKNSPSSESLLCGIEILMEE